MAGEELLKRTIQNKNPNSNFETKKNTLNIRLEADKKEFAFYSIPYDRFWKVKVNGYDAEMYNCNGLIAIPVEKGENIIEFRYEYTPFKVGISLSAVGCVLFALYDRLQKNVQKKLVKIMKNKPVLYIIIPCYNEEKVLPITAPLFKQEIMKLINRNIISVKSKIMFVNDGSKDQTWNILCELAKKDDCFLGISQSRNRGHQNAVLAGLMESKDQCDITISIDCDGQDDINAMDSMVEEYLKGNEIVYGVRSRRDTDTFFKRFTAESFYKLLNWMGVEVIYNHADYRLISSRVLQEFANYKEVNIFLRGMVPLVGFKSTIVYYERHERIAGESHYPLSKMLSLAFDGLRVLALSRFE